MFSKINRMKQNICTQIKNHNRYNTLKGIRFDKYNVVLTIAIYLPEKREAQEVEQEKRFVTRGNRIVN